MWAGRQAARQTFRKTERPKCGKADRRREREACRKTDRTVRKTEGLETET